MRRRKKELIKVILRLICILRLCYIFYVIDDKDALFVDGDQYGNVLVMH